MNVSVEIAEKFAKALDCEDYKVAQNLLSKKCKYFCRGQHYLGPSEIIQTYKGNGDDAAAKFDSVTYESSVLALPDGTALISFVDHLSLMGKSLTFRCEQVVEVDKSHQITRIEHRDIQGQREALAEFMDDGTRGS